jgi:hypothetical protein
MVSSSIAEKYKVTVTVLDLGKTYCTAVSYGKSCVLFGCGDDENDYYSIKSYLKTNAIYKIEGMVLWEDEQLEKGCFDKVNSEHSPKTLYLTKYCNAPEKIGINTQERYHNTMNSLRYKEVFNDFLYFNRVAYQNKTTHVVENLAKVKIRNPHLAYTNEQVHDKHTDNQSELSSARGNKSQYSTNMMYGMDEVQYSKTRKLASSRSTSYLLRGYQNISHLNANSNNSNINTNTGTNSRTNSSKGTLHENGYQFVYKG